MSSSSKHDDARKRKRGDGKGKRASKRSKSVAVTVEDFHEAAARGDLPLCKQYIRGGGLVDADLSAQRRHDTETALWKAAQKGELAVCEYLMEHGADVHCADYTGCTVMHAAALSGCTSTMKAVYDKDPEILEVVNDDNATPLFYVYDIMADIIATRDTALETAGFLICELGADTDQGVEVTFEWQAFVAQARELYDTSDSDQVETL